MRRRLDYGGEFRRGQMRYEGYGSGSNAIGTALHWLSMVRKTMRDERRARRAYKPDCGRLTQVGRGRSLGQSDIALIVSVRNEATQLPAFLAHYRELGVSRFLVIDDRSEDGTFELLEAQRDVDLFTSEIRYGDAQLGGLWYFDLACRYGLDRWYLQVDADEYFVYDGMHRHKLPDLIRALERQRIKRLLAPMIDLYPSVPLSEAVLRPGQMPWEVADHLDGSGYSISARPYGPVIEGGGMGRVFGDTLRQKFPLLYWDRRTSHYRTIHFPLPYSYSPYRVLGALLHFKCFSNFSARAAAALADGQHAGDGVAYKRYHQATQGNADLNMMCPDSVRYRGPEQLVELGFMEPISYDDG